MSFVETWMNLESVIESQVGQKEKNEYHILMHICGIQKNGKQLIPLQSRNRDIEQMYGYQGGREVGKNRGIEIDIYTIDTMYKIDN